jgi:tetratricopeptide (TPR) repeat protein
MGIKWIIDKKPRLRSICFGFLTILALVFAVNTYKQNKTWKNSLTLWNNIIDKYPEFSLGYFYRANIMFRQGGDLLQHAIKDYDRAIELKNDHAEFYRNRGSAKYNSGDYKGAISDFSKAIELAPEYAGAFMDRGGAKTKIKEKDLEGAIADISRAIEIIPNYWDAYYRRAIIKRMKGDHEAAIQDLDIYIDQIKNNPVAYLQRGLSKNALGFKNEACNDLDRSVKLGNSQAKSMYDRYCR